MNFQNISIQILLHEHMYQSLIIDQDTLTAMLIGPGEIYLNQLQKRFLYFFKIIYVISKEKLCNLSFKKSGYRVCPLLSTSIIRVLLVVFLLQSL